MISDFFDFAAVSNRKITGLAGNSKITKDLYKTFKVHDFEQLLILSGLYSNFCDTLKQNPDHKSD
jgi:hypothetical protein